MNWFFGRQNPHQVESKNHSTFKVPSESPPVHESNTWREPSTKNTNAWQDPASSAPSWPTKPLDLNFKKPADLNLFDFIADKSTAERSKLALTICTVTSTGKYLLVEPNLAKGAFGQASVWLDLSDKKLYVRKVQKKQNMGEEPRDGTHHFNHPGVPGLISTMNHGPQPSDMDPYGNNVFKHKVWTTMTEYIHGFSLEKTIDEHQDRSIYIPEPEIWSCAAALLEVIIEMRHPIPGSANGDRSMIHHDLFPRNVVVERIESERRQARYWLIDFGLATREGEENHKTSRDDIFAISQLMFAMMARTSRRALWDRAHVQKRITRGAPYSPYLYACACRLQDEAIKAAEEGNGMSRSRVDFWLKLCRGQAVGRLSMFSRLCTKPFEADKQPVIVWDETISQINAELTMGFLNEEVWGPYRYAWVDKNTLELKFLEPYVLWGKNVPVFRPDGLLSDGG